MLGIFIINNIEKENFKFGGLYYHHKKTKENTVERKTMKMKTMNNNLNVSSTNLDGFTNILALAKEQAKSDIYDFSEVNQANPFRELSEAVNNNKKLIDTKDFLIGDKIILLPYNGILDYSTLDVQEMSLISLEMPNGFAIGFLTLSKLVKEYEELIRKGDLLNAENNY